MDEHDHRNHQNCTSNCSNSSRILELSRTLSNSCSQKIELNNPDLRGNIRYFEQGNYHTYGQIRCTYTILANPIYLIYALTVSLMRSIRCLSSSFSTALIKPIMQKVRQTTSVQALRHSLQLAGPCRYLSSFLLATRRIIPCTKSLAEHEAQYPIVFLYCLCNA